MISYEDALNVLHKYIKDKPTIEHSLGVSEFAFKLAKKINLKHPEEVSHPLVVHDPRE